MNTLENDLQRATSRLAQMVRRVERDGLRGRNADATVRGIDAHLAAGNEAIRQLCADEVEAAFDEDRHGRMIDRFWTVERRAHDVTR